MRATARCRLLENTWRSEPDCLRSQGGRCLVSLVDSSGSSPPEDPPRVGIDGSGVGVMSDSWVLGNVWVGVMRS